MKSKEFRPADWDFIRSQAPEYDHYDKLELFEAGASAMLSALIKWLNEPCTRHKHYNTYSSTYTRNECSKCWAKLKEVK